MYWTAGIREKEEDAQQWEDCLLALEDTIRRARAQQVELLSRLDVLQVDLADGDQCMEGWTSAHLDVSSQTATRLMWLARHSDSSLREHLARGQWGLDRAYLLSKLEALGAPSELVSKAAQDYSLGRLWGLVEEHQRQSRDDEQARRDDRYLVLQPSLDQGMHKLWGQLYGTDGEAVVQALTIRADSFPVLPDGCQSQGQRLADALVSIATDSLTGISDQETGSSRRAVAVAEVFVDASLAAASLGEAGVSVSSGLRVGAETLHEILCEGKVRVIWTDGANGPVAVSHLTDTIPPAIRAFIWKRDQGSCSIEGCRSRHRLQVHHIRERHQGGNNDPDNLVLLCWYHHHVAIHSLGFEVDPNTPIHRRRLLSPGQPRPPPAGNPQPRSLLRSIISINN